MKNARLGKAASTLRSAAALQNLRRGTRLSQLSMARREPDQAKSRQIKVNQAKWNPVFSQDSMDGRQPKAKRRSFFSTQIRLRTEAPALAQPPCGKRGVQGSVG